MHIMCWEEVCYERLSYKSKLPLFHKLNISEKKHL